MERKSWDEYYLNQCFALAERSTCERAKVGAIIVKNHRIIGHGYNGSIKKHPHCTDKTRPLLDGGCLIGENCGRTIHAEKNALIHAHEDTAGATLYCTHEPCHNCTKEINQAGIKKVVFAKRYENPFNQHFIDGMEWVDMSSLFSKNPSE